MRDESHPVFARVWARLASLVDSDDQRVELLAGLRGRVLEVGAGEGRNFAHYPSGVVEVVAVEPERYLRRIAAEVARGWPVVKVLDGRAEALPVADDSCDAAVASLVLCSVTDQAAALAELRRALAPGGELRFYEHVVAEHDLGARLQRVLDRTGIWPRLGGGCHVSRDTLRAIEDAGFTIEAMRRFPSGPGPFGLPLALGRARLP
jgi:ubiquinone/menaquinone biosynthesis C-methylase UbiE